MQSDPPTTVHPRGRAENLHKELPTYKDEEFPEILKRDPTEQDDPPPIFLYGFACDTATLVRYAENNDIAVLEGIEFPKMVRIIRNHMQIAFNNKFVRIQQLNKCGKESACLYGVAAYNSHLYHTAPPALEKANGPTISETIEKIRLALEIVGEPEWYAEKGVTWKELSRFI